MEGFKFLTPNHDKENKSTPIYNAKKRCLHLTPILKTPNGSKVSHPFVKNLITNRYNSQINDDFFKEKEHTPNIDCFSPDFAGTLFPKEINTSHVQLECFDKLYKKYRDYLCVKSSQILIDESIAPSPDSGIGSSMQTTKSNLSAISGYTSSMFIVKTPPSQFKWNREEYRNDLSHDKSEDDLDDEYIPNWNFESTQIFDNSLRLADNISMRRHSVIKLNGLGNGTEVDQSISTSTNGRKRKLDANCSISSILRDSVLDDLDIDNDLPTKPLMKSSLIDPFTDCDLSFEPHEMSRSSPNVQWNLDIDSDLIFEPVHFDIGNKFTDIPNFDLSPIKMNPDDDSV